AAAPLPRLPWARGGISARRPPSERAFRTALASAEWLPRPLEPGAHLWEKLPVPVGRGGLLAPLRVEYNFDAVLTDRVFGVLSESHVDLGHVLVLDPASDALLVYASTDIVRFPPTSLYPAASLIKVVPAAAALESSPDAEDRPCRFDGSPYRLTPKRVNPPPRGREVSLRLALATSSTKCCAQLAVHQIGPIGMLDVIRRFGLLEAPAPAHAAGQALDPGLDFFAVRPLRC